ncbi:SusD/RagB family nutrient-binding outer membrane lipoprotein [Christiangramia forsetii]|nr:SusD/RagB family nutrient-binding outer membrane lipoprotein [Christiangramia forsetii]
MKKYIIALLALVTLWSCQSDEDYEDLNRDPKNPTQVSEAFLFTSATVSLGDQLATPNVNLNVFRFLAQYLSTTTYLDEPNYNLTNRNIPQNHWSEIYRDVIFDLQNAKTNIMNNADLSETEKSARIGQAEVLEVYAWHVLVDSFGDIPYTEALDAQQFPLPAYDDASTIYGDLISRLDSTTADLEAGQGFTSADVIYGGNMDKWVKFANSLKLRLAMRLSDVNPSLSQSAAESAISGGIFTSNDDSALIAYQGSFPNTNPLWEDLVQSGRSDYLAANTIVDYLNDLNDPRRMYYFDDNLSGGYVGGIYGGSNSFPFFTHIGEDFRDPTHPGIFLDYAEVEFYLTEAVQDGYSAPGSAESHYNAAITASIMYAGGTQADVDSYLSQSSVAYDGTEYRLGFQFWIAMYDNPFQGWSVWRKYDAPELNVAADSGRPVPLRYTYPVNEQNLNPTSYEAASSAIGGDDQQTPIFWDVE